LGRQRFGWGRARVERRICGVESELAGGRRGARAPSSPRGDGRPLPSCEQRQTPCVRPAPAPPFLDVSTADATAIYRATVAGADLNITRAGTLVWSGSWPGRVPSDTQVPSDVAQRINEWLDRADAKARFAAAQDRALASPANRDMLKKLANQ
jgi:hypothetical protein